MIIIPRAPFFVHYDYHPSSTDERAATRSAKPPQRDTRTSRHHSCRARVITESYNRTAPRTPYRGASHRPHRAKGEPWPGIHTARPTRHNRPQIRRRSLADHLSRFHHVALFLCFYHITPSHHNMRAHRNASSRRACVALQRCSSPARGSRPPALTVSPHGTIIPFHL